MLTKFLLILDAVPRVDSAVAFFSAKDCYLFSSFMRIAREYACWAYGGLLANPTPTIGGLPAEALVLPPAGVPTAAPMAFSFM